MKMKNEVKESNVKRMRARGNENKSKGDKRYLETDLDLGRRTGRILNNQIYSC